MEKSARIQWIDLAKVIAILVVVLNHSTLVIPGVNFWGGMFFVPAFFLVSGYTYSQKEISYKGFAEQKAKRLLLPYFAANLLLFSFFFLKNLMAGGINPYRELLDFMGIFYGRNQLYKNFSVVFDVNQDNIYLMTSLNAPTWFLPALFLVLISVEAMLRIAGKNRKRCYLLTAVLAFLMLIYHYVFPYILPWCLDILPFLMGYFELGYELRQEHFFERMEKAKPSIKYSIWIGILAVTILCGSYNRSANISISYFGKSVMLGILLGMTSSVLLLQLCKKADEYMPKMTNHLAKLGRYTLTILCYHFFILQMFLSLMNVVTHGALDRGGFLSGCIKLAGIIFCILACVLLDLLFNKIVSAVHKKNK